MQGASTLFTYDDYLTIPNDGKRYEIVEGELLMTPAPSIPHQETLANLLEILRSFVRSHGLGKVFCAPIDVVLSMTNVVQPDIVFVSKERQKIITKKNIVDAPDLIIEILFEATEKTDRTTKKALYEHAGVKEYWIVDPEMKVIEVYERIQNRYASPRSCGSEETLTSPLIPGLSFKAAPVFGQD